MADYVVNDPIRLQPEGPIMLAVILFLIIVWIIAGIIGATVHGLIWLLVVAAILFVATLVFGGTRLTKSRR